MRTRPARATESCCLDIRPILRCRRILSGAWFPGLLRAGAGLASKVGISNSSDNSQNTGEIVQDIRMALEPGIPTVDQLKVFLAVVETGSFTAAAKRLRRAVS